MVDCNLLVGSLEELILARDKDDAALLAPHKFASLGSKACGFSAGNIVNQVLSF